MLLRNVVEMQAVRAEGRKMLVLQDEEVFFGYFSAADGMIYMN